ncbi:MAG: LPS export ABC transporter permease LptF [Thermodesulfobacteriota bacterium]|nr:LPS export ABC transporter permease LptF [Thermodesulfobacteriota bacterium]
MKITLYRYFMKELLTSFLLGLVGFTFILLTGRILQLAELFVNKGISLVYILSLLYYLLPSFLVLTIPMATLLSVMLTFNRLSGDNEITAIKASGVSLYQLTPPVLVLALLTFMTTSALSLYSLPKANQASRSLLFELASTKAHAGIRERVFNDDFEGLVLYVERVTPKTFQWENVFISDSRNAAEVHTIIAREGMILSDPQELTVTLQLKSGAIHKLGKQPEVYQKVDFNTYNLRLNLKTGLKEKQNNAKHPADMSLRELSEAIQALRSKKADSKFQWIKIHEKFSIPFACLVFGVIGIPLGIQSHGRRSGKSIGFAWSIGVLLIYYLLTNGGISLAERGVILLEAGMWFPNAIFLCCGLYLLIKAANESPVLLMVWLNKGIDRLRKSWSDSPEPQERRPAE